jgi:RimJ/RimL family protein N-acetyltransferase
VTLASLARITGPGLVLRLVQPDDAAFVHALRSDPALNAHLSAVTGTVDDQRRWIDAYKPREAALRELYYVIERRDGRPCGLVRLYDIGEESFTWGSWVLGAGKPPKAALESAVLSLGIGFEQLDLPLARIEVRADNAHAIAFYRRFGMAEDGGDAVHRMYRYDRAQYRAARDGHLRLLAL